MASRLSHDSSSIAQEAGHHALAWVDRAILKELPTAKGQILDAALEAEDPDAAVGSIPVQELYLILRDRGLEDCLQVLPHVSSEQMQRLVDYDIWRADALDIAKMNRWLALWREISSEELSRRFTELDEELQLAFLGPLVEVFDEEALEKLPHDKQDELIRLPCNTLSYCIKGDQETSESVQALIGALLSTDLPYAYSLLQTAAALPPREQESMALQFRTARLEEDGFVPLRESLQLFAQDSTLDFATLGRALSPKDQTPGASEILEQTPKDFFLSEVLPHLEGASSQADFMERLQSGLAYLANALAAACHVEPDEVMSLRRLNKLGLAYVSLGLELNAAGCPQRGAQLLTQKVPAQLFRTGLSALRLVGDALLACLGDAGLPEASRILSQHRLDRRATLLTLIDRHWLPLIGLQHSEMLRGLLSRFPLMPIPDPSADSAKSSFVPLDRRARLNLALSMADRLTGMVALATHLCPQWTASSYDIDQVIGTAAVRALLGQEERFRPLTTAEFQAAQGIPLAERQALLQDFVDEAYEFLSLERSAIDEAGSGASWSVHRRLGLMGAAESARGVLADLHQLLRPLGAKLPADDWQGLVIIAR